MSADLTQTGQRTLLPPFRCGHPRTDENMKPHTDGRFICRTCQQKHSRRHKQANYRRYYLPGQIENTRRKLLHLEREALALGLTDLLHPGRQA